MNPRMPALPNAACATPTGAELFAHINPATIPTARNICNSCPAQQPCLLWGVLYEDHGMWGGRVKEELRTLRRQHGIRRQDLHAGWVAPKVATSRKKEGAV